MSDYTLNTKCVRGGLYARKMENRVDSDYSSRHLSMIGSEDMGKLFDWKHQLFLAGYENPTNDYVAAKGAELEGGAAAMLTSIRTGSKLFALFNICECGSHIVASSSIYGGTYNLIAVTLAKMGIRATFVSPDCTEEELNAAFTEDTRAVFGETIANPALTVS